MANKKLKEKQRSGFLNWGTGLAAVIILFVTVTLGIVFYLSSLEYHMVSENHYENAVKYQQQIDRIERTRSLKKSVVISHSESQEIHIQFPDKLANPQPMGTVRLYRPSDAGLDQSYKLSLDTSGSQFIPTADLKKGKWLIQITWKSNDKEFFEEAVIFL